MKLSFAHDQNPACTNAKLRIRNPLRYSVFGIRSFVLLLLGGLTLPTLAQVQSTNRSTKLDYSDFRIVSDRNIFNQRRYARSNNTVRRETRRVTRSDYVSLVGVMDYEKGTLAFFDSSNSEFRKVFKLGDTVAGYKICAVAPSSVKLDSGTNQLDLRVGMQLRREEDGPWQVAATPVSGSSGPPSSSYASRSLTMATTQPRPDSTPPPPDGEGGPGTIIDSVIQTVLTEGPNGEPGSTNAVPDSAGTEDSVLRRLMQRREQEINR